MVLPVRIELTTSALPRMRSTTELRQHCLGGRAGLWLVAAPASSLPRALHDISPTPMTGSGPSAKDEREARLAAALRDNLRRRKAQARGDGLDQQTGDQKDDAQPASE